MSVYKLKRGKHSRIEGGVRVRYLPGDNIELSEDEARSPVFRHRVELTEGGPTGRKTTKKKKKVGKKKASKKKATRKQGESGEGESGKEGGES